MAHNRLARPRYDQSVFLNVPFDEEYAALFTAVIFVILECGFVPRCTKEVIDSSRIRLDIIAELMASCRFGLHDLSRTGLYGERQTPRFNMPLELGLFIGAKRFSEALRQRRKECLVLVTDQYGYQAYCSDISGQDVGYHAGSPWRSIEVIRNWLQVASAVDENGRIVPSGTEIAHRYRLFRDELPVICAESRLDCMRLTFIDYRNLAYGWQLGNPW